MDLDKKIKSEYNRKYREAHKEQIKAYQKQYRETHKEELRAYQKAYQKDYQKAYQEAHREKLSRYGKEYRKEHKSKHLKTMRERIARTSYAPKHQQRWTAEEERMVLNPNMTLYELALKMGRSEAAINGKRVRLRKYGASTSTLKEVIDNE